MTTHQYGQRLYNDGKVIGVVTWPGFDPATDKYRPANMVTRPVGGTYDEWVAYEPITPNSPTAG